MKTLILGAATVAGVLAIPAATFAATYAYVNTSGEVMSVEAANSSTALATAPGIALHSGVMLIDDSSNDIVGYDVAGF